MLKSFEIILDFISHFEQKFDEFQLKSCLGRFHWEAEREKFKVEADQLAESSQFEWKIH